MPSVRWDWAQGPSQPPPTRPAGKKEALSTSQERTQHCREGASSQATPLCFLKNQREKEVLNPDLGVLCSLSLSVRGRGVG